MNAAIEVQAGTSPLFNAAMWYAQRGWPIFPLHGIRAGKCTCGSPTCGKSAGKHPRTKHGVHDATADPALIAQLWRQFPDANIGLATGEPSGVDVLDVDPRHYGDESLWDL